MAIMDITDIEPVSYTHLDVYKRQLWGYEVRQGTVLYLALEDNHRRLQERLYRMFGVESTGNLFFAIGAKMCIRDRCSPMFPPQGRRPFSHSG